MFEIARGPNDEIILRGHFDAPYEETARDFFMSLRAGGTVDLTDLNHISDRGIEILRSAQRRLSERGHRLYLRNPQPQIRDALGAVPMEEASEATAATERDVTLVAEDRPGTARTPDEPQIDGYRIVQKLGSGGMGEVFLAEDESLGRHVALKVISAHLGDDTASRARFSREARAMAKLEHPHIARVYSFGAIAASSYIVMEYVDGEVLADRIRRGPLPLDEALRIARQIATALETAWTHRIIHRDIKPNNILLDRRGDVRVVDFGLAKPIEFSPRDNTLTQDGHLIGTPHYLSPEQAEGKDVDFRSDIYALGITLFEMLSGSPPFTGPTPYTVIARHMHEPLPSIREQRADLSPAVDRLLRRLTAKKPEERPESYAELIASIDAMLRPIDVPTEALVVTPQAPEKMLPGRIPHLLIAFAALIVPFGLVAAMVLGRIEATMTRVVIAAALVLTACAGAAFGLAYSWMAAASRGLRIALVAVLSGITLAGWMASLRPDLLAPFAPPESSSGLLFTWGPYPSDGRLRQLKETGYTAVVSLLDPGASVFERAAARSVSRRAEAVGLEPIAIAVHPWKGPGERALSAVRDLAGKQSGRYYVHGYLGARRTASVRGVVEEAIRIRELKPPFVEFERGTVADLTNGVFLSPCPTEQELGRFVIEGGVREVVSLLDLRQPENVPIEDAQRAVLGRLNVPMRNAGVTTADYDPVKVLDVARSVRGGEKPVLVHSFFMPDSGRDPLAEAFVFATVSDRPPLAPLLFDAPMKRGHVQIVAPHIATGPRPDAPEFGAYLYRRGIRQFLYVGDPASEEARQDRAVAAENALPWRVAEPLRSDLLSIVSRGGPYYLYGPALKGVLPTLRTRFERELAAVRAASRTH